MYFNWPLFRKLTYVSLFKSRGTNLRLTAKRIGVLVAFFPLFIFMQLFTRAAWLIDSSLPASDQAGRRGYRLRAKRYAGEHRPLFILGNFRSGTTFLFRTLSRDTSNFASMKTWEIYLAPTVAQRLLYRGILAIDRLLGSPLLGSLKQYDEQNLGKVQFHKVGLWEPEEDEGLFLYPWAGLFVWFFFPYRDAVRDSIRFDERVPVRLKRKLDEFYAACVAKHMRSHPGSAHYLAKNPASCGKVESLLRLYPNARFVYLQRDPVAQFRSQMSWLAFAWRYFSDPLERYPFQRFALGMSEYWTKHAIETLSGLADDRVCFVRMEELVQEPKQVVTDLYRRLGYEVSPEFERVLVEQERRARSHRQNETADVFDLSLTEDEIRSALSTDLFEEKRRPSNASIH